MPKNIVFNLKFLGQWDLGASELPKALVIKWRRTLTISFTIHGTSLFMQMMILTEK